jgi:hypothetical protein
VDTGVEVPRKTSYLVIAEPPSLAGADHVRDTVDPEAAALKLVGGPGTVVVLLAMRFATLARIAGSWA